MAEIPDVLLVPGAGDQDELQRHHGQEEPDRQGQHHPALPFHYCVSYVMVQEM